MNITKAKELLLKLTEIKESNDYLERKVEELQDAIEEYERETQDGNYNYYFENIINEATALDRVYNLYSLEDIYDYINGCYGYEYYKDEYGRLEEFTDTDLEDIIDEIIAELEGAIENDEKQRLRNDLIEAIRNFDSGIVNTDTQFNALTENYASELVDYLLERFNITKKGE